MRIFVLLSRFPYPLEKGDKLRAYHQIRLLSKKHEIILCAFHEGHFNQNDLEQLKPFCKAIKIIRLEKKNILFNLFTSLFTQLPFQVGYYYSRGAHHVVREMLEKHKPDAIYCQLIRMAEFTRNENCKIKVLDYMDALSKGIERRMKKSFFLKPFLALEYRRLLKYEEKISNDFNALTIISEQDKEFLNIKNKNNIHVIPNGVDLSFFQHNTQKPEYDIVFIGNLAYPPNIEAAVILAKEIIPALRKKNPEISLLIAGASPGWRVKQLRNKNVIVKGWTEDVRTYYSSGKIFVAPLFIGSGMQNKVLEAMAMSLPCIVSEIVNKGIGAKPGFEILVAENTDSFVNKIEFLLASEFEQKQIAVRANDFVSVNYTWESSVKKLDTIFRF